MKKAWFENNLSSKEFRALDINTFGLGLMWTRVNGYTFERSGQCKRTKSERVFSWEKIREVIIIIRCKF